MFERFTDRARRVVVCSQEEARLLDHNYIGTEHVLLGLLHEGEGVAARALEASGVSLEAARSQVQELVGRGPSTPSGHIPFTPNSKRVLEGALREALLLGHNYIGAEHMLLGLLRTEGAVGVQVLVALDADPQRVRTALLAVLSGAAPAQRDEPGGAPRSEVAWSRVVIPGTRLAPSSIELVSCGFCGRRSPDAGPMLRGPTGVLLCEHCVDSGYQLLRGSEPVGAPASGESPADPDAAEAAIREAFARMTETETGDESGHDFPFVDGGVGLATAIRGAGAAYRHFGPSVFTVERIRFLSPVEAEVFWRVDVGTLTLPQVGRALFVDRAWKVSRETLAALVAPIGVRLPPREE